MGRSSRGQGSGFGVQKISRRWRKRANARFSARPRLEALERRDLLTSYAYTTAEDTPLAVTDSTISGATIVTAPTHGKVSFAASGGFVYTPAENYNGSDGFTFSIDPNTTSPPTTLNDVSITITPVNDRPKVFPDQFAAQENTTLTVDAPGVLKNDTDVDGDPLMAILATKPLHGTVQLGDGGGFSYTPATDYFGPDSFTYKASDGQATSDATTAYLYVAQNKPVAKDDYYGVAQNGSLNIPAPGVLANDLGVNGRSMTASLEDGKGPQHGSVTVNGDGSFTYTPATGYIGDDSFVYRATDNSPAANPLPAAFADATVHLSVRSTAPIVYAANDSYTALQNATLSIAAPGVLGNDKVYSADATSNTGSATPLSIPLNSVIVSGAGHGTVTLNVDGSFTYAAAQNYVGSDAFTYRAVMVAPAGTTTPPAPNPISHDVATVSITVHAQNAPPTPTAKDDHFGVLENATLNIAAPGVLGNDVKADDYPLVANVQQQPVHGSLTLNGDGSFTYQPAAGYTGDDSFTYYDSETYVPPQTLGGPVSDPIIIKSAPATVTISVRAPVVYANNDSFNVVPGATLTIDQPGVLKNDYVFDPTNTSATTLPLNLPLFAAVVNTTPNGQLTLNADGSFTYTPNSGFTGTDSFTYRASLAPPNSSSPGAGTVGTDANGNITTHDVATVTIVVRAPVPALVANNDYFKVLQGGAIVLDPPGVLANDKGPDGHKLAAVLDTSTSNGTLSLAAAGGFTYTPDPTFSGYDKFTYHVIDTTSTDSPQPTSSIATVTIYVAPLHPPVYASPDFYQTLATSPLSVSAPGVLGNDRLYPPTTANSNGTVDSSNTQQPIPPIGDYTLTASLVNSVDPASGTLDFHSDGSFTFTAAAGFSGQATFTYQATATASGATSGGTASSSTAASSAATNIATVTIYVKQPEPPPGPVASNDYFLTAENTELDIRTPGVLANDYFKNLPTPQPGTTPTNSTAVVLKAILVAGPADGTGKVTLNSDGSFAFVPATDFIGAATFTYQDSVTITAADGTTTTLLGNIATVTIKIVPAIAHPDAYQVQQDSTLVIAALGVLTNDQGGSTTIPLTATPLMQPIHGALTLNSDGSFKYVPTSGYSGPDLFTYRATVGVNTTPAPGEGNGTPTSTAIDVGIVKIYVMPTVSRAIEAHDDKYMVAAGNELDVDGPGVLANDNGPVNVPVIATVATDVQHGTLTLNSNGGFTYTPAAGFTGEDHFTYAASPATAGSTVKPGTATVTIYVLASNTTPPVIVGGNQSSTDESGPQTVADFAAVPVDDDGQPPPVTVTTDHPELFKVQPAIDSTGQLTFTPAPNASGDATVTVTTHDPSGDTTQTFSIHIDKPHLLHNANISGDVNNDGTVAPNDLVKLISYLNGYGASSVQTALSASGEGESGEGNSYYDVSGDDQIAPIDLVMIISALNGHDDAPAGESSPAAMDSGLLALVAQDTAEATMGRKKVS
jgi:Big-like domain-containing protein/cadherin-like protein/dockerin type I repeat protein